MVGSRPDSRCGREAVEESRAQLRALEDRLTALGNVYRHQWRAGDMVMFFGARTPDSLPYFGPLKKVPETLLHQHLVFSRVGDGPKEYVQDRMMAEEDEFGT